MQKNGQAAQISYVTSAQYLRSLVYHSCLTVCNRGTKVVHKRRVQDITTNNYNPHFMLAWDGNMDLQLCLCYFSIVTYITDYMCKPEHKLTAILKDVNKTMKRDNIETKNIMYAMVHVSYRINAVTTPMRRGR